MRLTAIEEASLLALHLPRWEARQWRLQWRSRWFDPATQGSNDPTGAQSSQTGEPPRAPSDWELLESQFEGELDQLAADDVATDPLAGHRARGDRASYFSATGPALHLEVARGQGWLSRWFVAVLGVVLLVSGWRQPEIVGRLAAFVNRTWRGCLLAFGLIWWIWWTPSVIGAIVTAIALAAILQEEAARRRPADGALDPS